MEDQLTYRIFTKGGIFSPDDLRKLTEISKKVGCKKLSLGFRQELYIQINKELYKDLETGLKESKLAFGLADNGFENIVSSYSAIDITPSKPWLLGDTYLDILEQFDFQPQLKINITDPSQNLVPLFTGQLNFIASDYPRYWYLYLRLEKLGKMQLWPVMIDGDDIGALSYLIQSYYLEENIVDLNALFQEIDNRFKGKTRPYENESKIYLHEFPLFEGFHKEGNNYWLGIYKRKLDFTFDFIEALYQLCIQTKVGNICVTPHKSILIKNIREDNVGLWKKLLGIYGIINQHSSLELNWQLPDLDEEAIQLKNTLVRELEDREVRTEGLSFAIKTKPIDIITSVLIKKEANFSDQARLSGYSVYYTPEFKSNSSRWVHYKSNVSRELLLDAIAALCKQYYLQIGSNSTIHREEQTPIIAPVHELYQCKHCFTVYDQQYGDSISGIAPGTAFTDLPSTYICSVCDAEKENFILLENQICS